MAVHIPVITRVFIKDPALARHSAHHTIYYGDGAIQPGKEGALYKIELIGGIKRGMEQQVYERINAQGEYLTTDRPKARLDDED